MAQNFSAASLKHKVKEEVKLLKLRYKLFKNREKRRRFVPSDVDLGGVYLFYWKYGSNTQGGDRSTENIGDYLSKVVTQHYAPKNKKAAAGSPKTIYAIGSVLGFRNQDATVWGSGFLYPNKKYILRAKLSDLDVRAVRGPKTRQLLQKSGKKCPEVYGDPAILMPLIYMPESREKQYDVGLVFNYANADFTVPDNIKAKKINVLTDNYKGFISDICRSRLVISSSLHGIILAEAYGVPAVLLLKDNQSTFKYEDWYNSTGRFDIKIAHSVDDALKMTPMELPKLGAMQEKLIAAFPYDLWKD
ncbi:MAG: polysaccharide pyruvyl transferase family protein [Clostridia bacterium]|nr:polysaccharide pyruvyl transferase family protein [Clostridia bacterium]